MSTAAPLHPCCTPRKTDVACDNTKHPTSAPCLLLVPVAVTCNAQPRRPITALGAPDVLLHPTRDHTALPLMQSSFMFTESRRQDIHTPPVPPRTPRREILYVVVPCADINALVCSHCLTSIAVRLLPASNASLQSKPQPACAARTPCALSTTSAARHSARARRTRQRLRTLTTHRYILHRLLGLLTPPCRYVQQALCRRGRAMLHVRPIPQLAQETRGRLRQALSALVQRRPGGVPLHTARRIPRAPSPPPSASHRQALKALWSPAKTDYSDVPPRGASDATRVTTRHD